MTRRTVVLLAAILAILVVLVIVGQREGERPPAERGVLASGLKENLDDVTEITVTKAGGEVVATLGRSESGWVVAERENYPADLKKLRAALVALGEARKIEQKTSNPKLYDRLGVESVDDADASGVMVSIAGLAEPLDIIIGDAAGSDYRYVRLKDAEASWLIDRDPDVPDSTGEWLAAELIDIDGERIQAVIVSHPDGETVRVEKTNRDQANFSIADVPAGRELLYDSVANVMGNVLEKLQLEDVEPVTKGPEAPPITTEFRTFDGLIITATALDRDDTAWVSFTASFDGEQAAAFATPAAEDGDEAGADGKETGAAGDESPATEADADAESPSEPAPDVAAEAAALNERLAGWRYKITRYKFDQMTREMEDLLQAPPSDG